MRTTSWRTLELQVDCATSPWASAARSNHPPETPQLIEECFTQLLATASAIDDPFEQAFFAMVHLPYLQPLDDVNKRVSRLAANIPFIKENLSPLTFTEVPRDLYTQAMLGVYELNRTELLVTSSSGRMRVRLRATPPSSNRSANPTRSDCDTGMLCARSSATSCVPDWAGHQPRIGSPPG